jgi:hypothetical protein
LAESLVVVAAALPFVTATAEAGKVSTGWLKVKVKVTGPVAAELVAPLMTTAGAGLKVWATAGAVALPPQLSTIGNEATRRASITKIPRLRLVLMGSPWLQTAWMPE